MHKLHTILKLRECIGLRTASKSSQFLGINRRNKIRKETDLIVPLYKAIVRPHL